VSGRLYEKEPAEWINVATAAFLHMPFMSRRDVSQEGGYTHPAMTLLKSVTFILTALFVFWAAAALPQSAFGRLAGSRSPSPHGAVGIDVFNVHHRSIIRRTAVSITPE
jgi:hypothetical protein